MNLNKRAVIFEGEKKVYTHLVIASHQDDVEIMCPQGIVNCYDDEQKGLVAVIVSDGGGSPRSGRYQNFTNEQMSKERQKEQIEAAKIGRYAKLVMLNYPSREIHDCNPAVMNDLVEILSQIKPKVVYTHNPAVKHRTHISVLKCALRALRELDMELRPKKLYGCECWRDLDWLSDKDKVVFDLSGYRELLRDVLAVHKTQIEGGKRYDLGAEGRRLANAVFYRSHNVDTLEMSSFAIDLTPLIEDDDLELKKFILQKIENFKREILV